MSEEKIYKITNPVTGQVCTFKGKIAPPAMPSMVEVDRSYPAKPKEQTELEKAYLELVKAASWYGAALRMYMCGHPPADGAQLERAQRCEEKARDIVNRAQMRAAIMLGGPLAQ